MRSLFLAVALLFLLPFGASAQSGLPTPPPAPAVTSIDKAIDVRAKLIDRYVTKKGYAWGVAVCGNENVFGDQSVYLTIYVYVDSVVLFANDFMQIAQHDNTTSAGAVKYGGITVSMIVIKRPKGAMVGGQKHGPIGQRSSRAADFSPFRTRA